MSSERGVLYNSTPFCTITTCLEVIFAVPHTDHLRRIMSQRACTEFHPMMSML